MGQNSFAVIFMLTCAITCSISSVNVPFLSEGMTDADYIYAFQRVIMPIAYEFDPDFVIGESIHASFTV